MKKIALVLIIFIFATVLCADERVVNLPLYEGAEVVTELNISDKDMLQSLRLLFESLPPQYAKYTKNITPEDIADVLKDVTRIQLVKVCPTNSEFSDVQKYYSENLPNGKWIQIFMNKSPNGVMTSIYTTENTEAFYCYNIKQFSKDNIKIKSVISVRIDGKIDFTKVAAICAKIGS